MAKGIRGKRQVGAIRKAFRVIEEALVRAAKVDLQQPLRSSPPNSTKRHLRLSPERRAQLKLQGRYMGYMRQLKPLQKARIKSLKERNGFTAAIRLAKQLASR